MIKIAYGKILSAQFINKVISICNDFEWQRQSGSKNPMQDSVNWLIACMAFETGETFSPCVENKYSKATGLIQFMPATAKGLNTTIDKLALMTTEEQLTYVKLYFYPYHKRIKTLSDMYMGILYPKAIGEPEDYVLFDKYNKPTSYVQNEGLDGNKDGKKDGKITKQECTQRIVDKLNKGLGEYFVLEIKE